MSTDQKASSEGSTSTSTLPTLKKSALAQAAAKEWTATTTSLSSNKSFASKPLFSLGLGTKPTKDTNGKDAATPAKLDAPTGFIFGSRLSEKVSNVTGGEVDDKPKDATSIFKQYAQQTSSGGGLFSTSTSSSAEGGFLKTFGDSAQKKSFDSGQKTNSDAQNEHVETVTGEEDETNLLHISCKFFIFDRETKSWLERGLGTMRINQKKDAPQEYRLVGRATGNQRVCLNSKIFPEMLIEKMSEKRIKLSAMSPDSDTPQLFVVSATPAAIANLHTKLESLLAKVKSIANRKRPLDPEHREKGDDVPPAKTQQKDENNPSSQETSRETTLNTSDEKSTSREEASTQEEENDGKDSE